MVRKTDSGANERASKTVRLLRRVFVILILIYPFLFSYARAQVKSPSKEQKILILLNGSTSMLQTWPGNTDRFSAASGIILGLMDSLRNINEQVELGLRVFGHQYPATENNCYDSRLEVPFSKDNMVQMGLRLRNIQPKGLSTVAFALNECITADVVNTIRDDYRVILITDSPESCSKEFCPLAKALIEKTGHDAFVIGLTNDRNLRQIYRCLGSYSEVTNSRDIAAALKPILDLYRRPVKAIVADQSEGYGYINVSNIDKVDIIALLYKTGDDFYPIPRSVDGLVKLVSGKVKVKTGRYKIIYKTRSSEESERELTVKNEMITELTL